MSKLKGITVTLLGETVKGKDPFGKEIIEESEINIENVLVAPATTDDIKNQLNIDGKKIEYTLAIPKNDTNDWTDKKVIFFGQTWHTVGIPLEGISDLIPLEWNRKVTVERYE
ncbi:hypothetical protein Javan263_0037 [Streptococcus phage Javan263]|uniref:Phage protein n=2 Tax=Streptococcus infantarius TaxID=102684 RepID=A0A380KP15_9STRE|nr:hypothetical protein [Streptococcus infantarius]EDT47247.1 hypothetical protein STRINF_01548 [Streptococcus infantarius subsp. infantarius ATCC BAA-102]QBX16628.1 hypothetical protein Javan263_0037 [Streptococcus phage Javan263]QQB29659.1 hypothetical protein I6H76_02075 [Streptococcus infantarius]SUN68089.1 phage protein [Streptococcus infantarius]